MDIEHLCWLREYLVTDKLKNDHVAYEFSNDSGMFSVARFFRVPQRDEAAAQAYYHTHGGKRAPGDRIGTTIAGPAAPYPAPFQEKTI